MNIDERLEALARRHEALTMNFELMNHQSEDQSIKIDKLLRVAELHNEQLAQDAEHIRALARIAEAHETRISRIEQ